MLASYLYRFKDTVTIQSKALGYIFVFVLMMITSLGIYGYLADAYQSGTTDMKQINASLDLKKQEQTSLQKRKGEIDAQIAQVAIKDVRGKQRLMSQFGPEVNTINKRLIALTAELQQEAQKQITTDSHVGPIVFVAKIIGMEPDNAISLLILCIVFAFDPLAIYLTIATNTALARHKEKQKDDQKVDSGQMFETYSFPSPRGNDGSPLASITEPEAEVEQYSTDDFPEPTPTDLSKFQEVSPLVSPGVSMTVGGDDAYFPPTIVREPVADMKVLGELFAKEQTEDLMVEEGTEAPPEQQLVKIYEETAAKAEPTPIDIETMSRIERFFARQDLIKNVRSGTVE